MTPRGAVGPLLGLGATVAGILVGERLGAAPAGLAIGAGVFAAAGAWLLVGTSRRVVAAVALLLLGTAVMQRALDGLESGVIATAITGHEQVQLRGALVSTLTVSGSVRVRTCASPASIASSSPRRRATTRVGCASSKPAIEWSSRDGSSPCRSAVSTHALGGVTPARCSSRRASSRSRPPTAHSRASRTACGLRSSMAPSRWLRPRVHCSRASSSETRAPSRNRYRTTTARRGSRISSRSPARTSRSCSWSSRRCSGDSGWCRAPRPRSPSWVASRPRPASSLRCFARPC